MDSRAESHATRGVARLAAYAELARISNLPTCLSNVLVGCAIGAAAGRAVLGVGTVAGLAVGIALLYIAGMALNGAADIEVDRAERPQRPIPSGRISLRAALFSGLFLNTVLLRSLERTPGTSKTLLSNGSLLSLTNLFSASTNFSKKSFKLRMRLASCGSLSIAS